ncbi:MAG: hypothetical protein BZ138_03710 [Methanosphaera sp. rholeuAM270]|nr:MAG: hypothetical protein BZ138_03710 [Methanosphaera sp. rholeuAM270]
MLQCMICGHKFDESKVDRTKCSCGHNCHGTNLPCPNCGFDVYVPRELRSGLEQFGEESFLSKVKHAFK